MELSTTSPAVIPQDFHGKNTTKIKVLVVDDHTDLVANIFSFLERKNFILDAAQDGISALKLCDAYQYDVLVLDWMLPKLNGADVLKKLRHIGSDLPILMLTAKTEINDKLNCFQLGADDYLTKPFSIAELEARILALHQRYIGRKKILQVGDLIYNLSTDEVTRAQKPLYIHSGGKKLLAVLMRESPNIVTKERLENTLWGDELPDKDLLRTHIYELRKRIDTQHELKLIKTIPRVGYQLSLAPENPCTIDQI